MTALDSLYRLAWCALLGSAAAACDRPTETAASDRAHYRAALTDPNPDAAVQRCGRVADPLLRGDCVVGVMQLRAARDPAYCALVPVNTPFHPECWFTAADAPDLPLDDRWALCELAGDFAPECRQHQRGRAAADLGAASLAVVEKAQRVAALIERDAHPSDLAAGRPARTWYALWLAHHNHAGAVRSSACEGLDDALLAACLDASAAVVAHRVRQRVHGDPGLCGEGPEEPLDPLLAGAPGDRRLARWVELAWTAACRPYASEARD